MDSVEQELMVMLRQLPVPIVITWRNGLYHWQCAQESGAARGLVAATEAAFRYVMSHPGMLLRAQEFRDS